MRERAFDIAKGIAIIAIVVGHVLRGLSAAGIANPLEGWYEEADTAFYLVHLAVFFFLSGLFVQRGVAGQGTSAYLNRRLTLFVWLFLLWTVIQGGVQVVSSRLVNTPISLGDIAVGLVKPLGQLWFLPALALFTSALVLSAPWRSRPRTIAVMGVASAISLWRWGVSGSWFFARDLGMVVFFAAGVVIAAPRVRAWLRSPLGLATGLLGLATYVGICVITDPTPPPERFALSGITPISVAWGIPAAIGGLVGVLMIARLLDAVPVVGAALAYVGEHSLEIFLAHIIFAAGARIVLVKAGFTGLPIHLLVGSLAGLLAPLVLSALATRLRLGWLFAAPAWWQDITAPGRADASELQS